MRRPQALVVLSENNRSFGEAHLLVCKQILLFKYWICKPENNHWWVRVTCYFWTATHATFLKHWATTASRTKLMPMGVAANADIPKQLITFFRFECGEVVSVLEVRIMPP